MKNITLSFITGLLAGIALMISLQTCTGDTYKPVKSTTSRQETEKQVAKTETGYNHSFDSLRTQSVQLQARLQDTRIKLEKSRQKAQVLQKTVYRLSGGQSEKHVNSNAISADTPCDSLATNATALAQTSELRDSLYEDQASNLEAQVKNKEVSLLLKTGQYQDIKSAFLKSMDEQAASAKETKSLTRQLKRQKVKSKLLTAAILLLSGAAANYMLHH